VGPATADAGRRPRSCSWTNFHLRTIGASALHTAAWNGDLGILEFLLEAGQHADTGDDDGGMTAMIVAIFRLTLMTMRCMIRDGEAIRRNIIVDVRL
jgi:ankyrin repeat protein